MAFLHFEPSSDHKQIDFGALCIIGTKKCFLMLLHQEDKSWLVTWILTSNNQTMSALHCARYLNMICWIHAKFSDMEFLIISQHGKMHSIWVQKIIGNENVTNKCYIHKAKSRYNDLSSVYQNDFIIIWRIFQQQSKLKHKDYDPLGCDGVWHTGTNIWRNFLPLS